jgi:hypothetical protein
MIRWEVRGKNGREGYHSGSKYRPIRHPLKAQGAAKWLLNIK